MPLVPLINRLLAGSDLDRSEAADLMRFLARGEAAPEQVAGVLVALQAKGVRSEELAGFAEVLRESVLKIQSGSPNLIDTAGTGGGRSTFNLSTGAAIVAAAAGAKVAKHGNRSVTSRCGSADVLEALGVTLIDDPERLSVILDDVGIAFMFAPNHHSSMRAVGPVRKALGVRTVFNQLGPLANPAGARRQLIGVYDRSLVRPMAEALAILGAERAYVVHSEDGMDEVSPCAPTYLAEMSSGQLKEGHFKPSDFGLGDLDSSVLEPGESPQENANILMSALDGSDTARSQCLVPNTAVALVLAGVAATIEEGAHLATKTIWSGEAVRTLDRLVEATKP